LIPPARGRGFETPQLGIIDMGHYSFAALSPFLPEGYHHAVYGADVVLRGDGGGKAPALARALHGRARVARTLMAWLRAGTRFGGITSRREEVNGQPGALFFDREGRLVSVMSLDIAEGQIQGVSSIINPDKLRHLGPLADLGALLRERS
jgi:RNA polymerase sigma-70 factor (ECF subfamily)